MADPGSGEPVLIYRHFSHFSLLFATVFTAALASCNFDSPTVGLAKNSAVNTYMPYMLLEG